MTLAVEMAKRAEAARAKKESYDQELVSKVIEKVFAKVKEYIEIYASSGNNEVTLQWHSLGVKDPWSFPLGKLYTVIHAKLGREGFNCSSFDSPRSGGGIRVSW